MIRYKQLKKGHKRMFNDILKFTKMQNYIAKKRGVEPRAVIITCERYIRTDEYPVNTQDMLNSYRKYYIEYKRTNK